MKRLRCQDLGFDCGYEIEAETEEEILSLAAAHALSVHHLDVTPELVDQVRGKIQELEPGSGT